MTEHNRLVDPVVRENEDDGRTTVIVGGACARLLFKYEKKLKESNGFWEYLYNILTLFVIRVSIPLPCISGFYILLPIAFAAAGILNIGSCSEESSLPIATAVAGILMCICYFLYLVRNCCSSAVEENRIWTCINRVIYVLTAVCLIICSVCVYRNYKPDYEHFNCNQLFYDFMFWALGFIYGLPCLLFVVALLFATCYPRFRDVQRKGTWLA